MDEGSCVSGKKLVHNKGLYENDLGEERSETYGSLFLKSKAIPSFIKNCNGHSP